MKKLLFAIICALVLNNSFSQNVGIGTTTPTFGRLTLASAANTTQLYSGISPTGIGISHSVASTSPTLGFNLMVSAGYKYMGDGYGSMFQYTPSTGNLIYFASGTSGLASGGISGFSGATLILDSSGYARFPSYTSFGSVRANPDSGRVLIAHNSTIASPHLQIHETSTTDFSRLEFTNAASNRYWHIAGFTSGVSTSQDRFNLYHNSVGDILSLTGDGRVGIGTTSPGTKLHVNTTSSEVIRAQGSAPYISLHDNTDGYKAYWWYNGTNVYLGTSGVTDLRLTTNGTQRAMISSDGRMVIGNSVATPAAGYLLSVDGRIISEELRVQNSSAWPDYVFKDDYSLMTLEKLEESIQQNKHLPNIPSAADVAKDGILVGDMHKRLLEKVEELTLYVIDLNKQNKKLDEEIKQLKKQIQPKAD